MLGLRLLKGAALGRLERAPALPARAPAKTARCVSIAVKLLYGESLSKYFSTAPARYFP
jgi:hypothetical protein